jgi:hypothetical protein
LTAAPGDALERQLAPFVVEVLEPIEAVAGIAHHLAGLADVADLLGEFEQPDSGADDLLVLGHGGVPSGTPRRGLRNP